MHEMKEALLVEEDLELNSAESARESEILFEDTSKRSENAKHFRLKNGHYMAAVYDKPIHFKDPESGEFKDLADRFCEKEDCYEADAGRFKARFPKKEGKAKFVTVEKDGTSVSWRYLPKASKRKNPEAVISHPEKKQPTDLPRFPHLKYEKEDTQTNLEYGISELGVKENIVLAKCPKDPTFRFELKLDGLKAVLTEDKKLIKLYSNNAMSDPPTLFIPPITMIDSAGIISEDAHYELAEEEGMTVLSVCVSPEWLSAKERLYPVIIDPQVNVEEGESLVQTMMYTRSDGETFKDPYFAFVGRDSLGWENHIYMKFDFPELPMGADFKNATLSLHQSENVGTDLYNVYKITAPWDVDTVSWSNPPSCSSSPLDSIQSKDRADTDTVTVDISSFARAYYNYNGNNHGVVIKRDQTSSCSCASTLAFRNISGTNTLSLQSTSCCSDTDSCGGSSGTSSNNCGGASQNNCNENTSNNTSGACNCNGNSSSCCNNCSCNGSCSCLAQSSLLFYTYKSGETYAPSLTVEYEMLEDFIDHQQYETFDAGASGVGGVSLSTGQLVHSFNDVALSGGKLPLNLSHLYRSDVANSSTDTTYGQGWFLSAAQTLTVLSNQGVRAAYRDAQGKMHYFNENDKDDSGWYHDFNGLGLSYNGNGTVKDEKGNTMTFLGGRLKTVSDAYGNTCTLSYNSAKLSTITDSIDRTLTCYYNVSGRLDYIRDFSGRETHYYYTSSGNLEKILRPDGSYTLFLYSGISTNAKLIRITDSNGVYFDITYDSAGKVSSLRKTGTKKLENNSLTDAAAVDGGGMDFAYYDSTTVVTDRLTNIKTVYRFDDCGHVLCSYEDLRYSSLNDNGITPAQVLEYGKLLNNTLKCETNGCYPTIEASLSGTNEMHLNYLSNSNFTQTTPNGLPKEWTVVGTASCSCCGDGGDSGVVSGGYESGFNAFKFSNPCNVRGNKYIYQTVSLEDEDIKGNFLIASAWVKATNPLQSSSSSAFFRLCALLTLSDGRILRKTADYDYSRINEWQYLAIPLEIPSETTAQYAEVRVDFSNNTGDLYVSNICLSATRGKHTHINYEATDRTILCENKPINHRVTTYDGTQTVCTYYDEQFDPVMTEIQKAGNIFVDYAKYDSGHQAEEIKTYQGLKIEYTYDSKGFRNSTWACPEDDSVDFDRYRILHYPEYDSTSGLETWSVDAAGVQTHYTYNDRCQIIKKEGLSGTNYVCNYKYEHTGNDLLTTVSSNNNSVANNFGYNAASNYLTSVSQNGFNYGFDYDPLGRVSKISAGENLLVSHTYTDGASSSVRSVFGNGDISIITYDEHGNPIQKKIGNTVVSEAEYDAQGNLRKVLDNLRNICYTYSYNADGTVRTVQMWDPSETNLLGGKYFAYDSAERLTESYDTQTDLRTKPIYKKIWGTETTDPEDVVIGVEVTGKYKDRNALDPLGRPEKRLLVRNTDSEESPFITDSYEYKAYTYTGQGDSALVTIGAFKHEYKQGSTVKNLTWHYEYDSLGNIVTVVQDTDDELNGENEIQIATYRYDELKRLTYDKTGNYTTEVEYDAGGNVISKFVGGEGDYTFEYNSSWKDRLDRIGFKAAGTDSYTYQDITYDGLGNPTFYKGNILTWSNVRRLTSYGTNTFAYGADGIRCQKNNTTYVLDGNRILKEYDGTKTILYYYGANGVIGFRYNGADYYYRKNLFGDVLAIYDSDGTVVATYLYDAWGKVLAANDKTDLAIANINPFRYRSYYYDIETGLYYVSSRYYDPEIGRWINADDTAYLGADGTPLSYNLFAYCKNNPVMGYDPSGTFDWGSLAQGCGWLATGIAALVVGVSVLTCGVATPLMVGVALATAGAGALTVANGASEIGEAFTGYNVMRDGVFQGNATAYNAYAYSTAAVAQVGTAICGGWSAKNAPRIKAYNNIQNYNYTDTISDVTHMSRPYANSVLTQKQVIKYGKMTKDSFGYVFSAMGSVNGKEKLWRLGINTAKGLVWHWGHGF